MHERYFLTGSLISLLWLLPTIAAAIELVSENGAGTDSGNALSNSPSVTANGRFVVFVSSAGNLGPTDTNGFDDVYVRDLETGITTLVSVNAAGSNGGNQPSDQDPPGISVDGRFVVFRSAATNLGPTVTHPGQVYVRDLVTGTTILASVNAAGTDGGNEGAGNPIISANGRYVVFESRSSDLHPTKTDLTPALFVRDLVAETTALVSVNAAGTATGNGNPVGAAISADGRFVAFGSNADDLVPTDTNDTSDVFVRDLVAETTTLVSVNATGTDSGNGSSGSPVISADGELVVFASNANDLGPTDTNEQIGILDLYARDLVAETTALVSVNTTGTDSGNGTVDERGHGISADGQVVVFRSGATDLTSGNITGGSLYARDLGAGTTTLVDVNAQGTGGANDGALGGQFKVSADGRFVVFVSQATNLSPLDKNIRSDVYLRDLLLETTALVSLDSKGKKSANGNSFSPVISADGQVVAFVSVASNLGPKDTNKDGDIYVSTNSESSVTVVAPNGGETWPIGSTQTIQWSSSGFAGKVKIELSRDGGATWTKLFNNVANTGSKTWKVKKPATMQARIRVSGVDDPSAVDASNANFTIQ